MSLSKPIDFLQPTGGNFQPRCHWWRHQASVHLHLQVVVVVAVVGVQIHGWTWAKKIYVMYPSWMLKSFMWKEGMIWCGTMLSADQRFHSTIKVTKPYSNHLAKINCASMKIDGIHFGWFPVEAFHIALKVSGIYPFRCQAAPFQCHTSQAKGCWYPGISRPWNQPKGTRSSTLRNHTIQDTSSPAHGLDIPVLTRRRSRTFRASTMGFAKGMATSNESHLGGWVRCERMGCKEDDCICAG